MNARTRIAKIDIDVEALRHNLQRVKSYADNSKVIAVVKANAYGHGVQATVDALSEADAFALATPNEAIDLRRAGVTKSIMVLQGFSSIEELKSLAKLDIQVVVHQSRQIDLLEQCPDLKLDIWLKVDTGMHRLGLPPATIEDAYRRLQACKSVDQIRLMTHFANADEINHPMNLVQSSAFNKLQQSLGKIEASMANSAALISLPESRKHWVRPGIMLYGSSPLIDKTADDLGLKPVMQFESKILAIQSLKKGDTVGYGSTWQCPQDMKIGVVAAGYADGYPRHAKSGTPVWLNQVLCPIVGRVSMDSLCIDLRKVEADIDDRVVLWGRELSVDRVAKSADTIAYELLCHAGNC